MSGLALRAALAGGAFSFLILMWICSCGSSRHGGCPLEAGETESELRGEEDVKCKGGNFQCAIPPSRIEGVKQKQSTQRCMVQDTNKGME